MEIAAIPISPEGYRPYGDLIFARGDINPVAVNLGTAKRYNLLGEIKNLRPKTARENLCLFRCSPYLKSSIDLTILERHEFSTQVLLPLGQAARYLAVVANGGSEPDLGTLKAFLVTGRMGITYFPGTWHHPLIALDNETDFACIVWEDGTTGDCEIQKLKSPITLSLSTNDRIR